MSNANRSPRLFVPDRLGQGRSVPLSQPQAHYLASVMRLKAGDEVRLFNGDDGEWSCTIDNATRKRAEVTCTEKFADAEPLADIDYLFAPLKAARLDYMAQKATEMGARRLRPVFTERTVPSRVNMDRLRANVIEAAEQCNMVAVPQVLEPEKLDKILAGWQPERRLIYCDESAGQASAIAQLADIPRGPLAVLIGPEGGFSPREQAQLRALDFVVPISLGPRIMRADTAAVAALAIVQSVLGDYASPQRD